MVEISLKTAIILKQLDHGLVRKDSTHSWYRILSDPHHFWLNFGPVIGHYKISSIPCNESVEN